ncbi:DUF420 domain-containing protein [candidate division GN15 bacterium]|jgi:uncharacterized membrane protein YozB (DUF420 family)|nr:DUF420 domain-containing protein [candidate division GN15 bacterium]
MPEHSFQPTLNASLNLIATIMLTFGYINIRKGRIETHKKFMISALVLSAAFLVSYVIYHYTVGSVPYPYHDWSRPVYFAVLIPHVILAALMTPFIVALVWFAIRERFDRHRRLARWVWPVWMFVSITGVIIYLMLYRPFA